MILNPAPACEIPDEMFTLADYVTPNETETEFFTGVYRDQTPLSEWRERAAKALHARGAKNVIITMGGEGAYFSGTGEAFMMPAFRISAVDTTAAGDAFNGGLAVRLAAGDGIRPAMRYASACGAIAAMRRGSMPSLPSADEVSVFLNEHMEE